MSKNAAANTPIHSITKFTTLDYPHHLASIFWFARCNMSCPYCYNPTIVLENGNISIPEALAFLQTRQGRLDGVVLSGGECTLYAKLPELCTKIKALGYKIKLDTNGSNPTMLKKLIQDKLVDYVALDYKAPLLRYPSFVGYALTKHIKESLDLLILENFAFEVRTTWHSDLLSVEEINAIAHDLFERGYKGTYYLQRYLHVEHTLKSTPIEHNAIDLKQLSSIVPIELRNF